jgi:hypothetical protein
VLVHFTKISSVLIPPPSRVLPNVFTHTTFNSPSD